MPALKKEDAGVLVRRRHRYWMEFQKRWRFLADSVEGGDRYRYADYSVDPTGNGLGYSVGGYSSGLFQSNRYGIADGEPQKYSESCERNLIPHVSEMGRDHDKYLLRQARTPVFKVMERVLRRHLSRIYAREVQRKGCTALMDWWEDVDGLNTPIDRFMRKIAAPLLMTHGQIDLCFDHPRCDDDTAPMSQADVKAMGLDRCRVSHILPENMLWWKLDWRGRYLECVVLERDDNGAECFRHWSNEDSVLYARDGEVIEKIPHSYGVVPIVRIFDERKIRCQHIGQPRYEGIAELQRAIYNAQSEQILSDVFHAHPILQVAASMADNDGLIKVGPDGYLVKGSDDQKAEFVTPPTNTSEFRRQHILDYQDEVIADGALTKPAGTTTGSTTGGVVAQSGISKVMDSQVGNDYLAEISETLGDCELIMAEFALIVLSDGQLKDADLASAVVTYPKEFDLFTAEDIATAIADIQGIMEHAGELEQVETELVTRLLRALLPGIDDARLNVLTSEVKDRIAAKAEAKQQALENPRLMPIDGYQDDEPLNPNVPTTAQVALAS